MEPTQSINKKIYIALLAVFLVIFAGTGLVMMLGNQPKSPSGAASTIQEQQVTLPTVAPKEGNLLLKLPAAAGRIVKGNTVTIQINADSNNENIVGWDALVDYDPTALAFVGAQSALADFKVYSYKRQSHVSLTSIKSLSSKTASVFKGTVVATISFRPIKTGPVKITLKPEIGKEKTNFVNTVTKRIYPQLNSVTLTVE